MHAETAAEAAGATAGRRARAARLAVLAALGAAAAGCERPPAPPPASRPATQSPYDERYVSALAAAGEFCRAWRRSDLAAGKAMLTLRVRRTYSDARMRDAIAGLGNPAHGAFEIGDGEPLPGGRMAFHVRLFFRFAGQVDSRVEVADERIVLARDESGQWMVDEFPMLAGEP